MAPSLRLQTGGHKQHTVIQKMETKFRSEQCFLQLNCWFHIQLPFGMPISCTATASVTISQPDIFGYLLWQVQTRRVTKNNNGTITATANGWHKQHTVIQKMEQIFVASNVFSQLNCWFIYNYRS